MDEAAVMEVRGGVECKEEEKEEDEMADNTCILHIQTLIKHI